MIRSAFVVALVGSAAVTQAGIIGDALVITASNSRGTSSFTVPAPAGGWSNWTWNNGSRITMTDNLGRPIASLENLQLNFVSSPVVSVNFTAVAGNVDTAFTFASGLLSFAATPFTNPLATASAGISVTDRNGNGASLVGNYDGLAHRADSNGLVPGGNPFALFIPSFNVASPFGTEVRSGSQVGVIPGVVTSISSEFSFVLSANDSVAGTSVFQIVPTPGSLAMLGVAGLAIGRRRR